MPTIRKVTTRLLAVLALVAVAFAVVTVVKNTTNDSHHSKKHHAKTHHPKKHRHPKHRPPATYTVKSGDTLTAIAHRFRLTVARIQALNPKLDPLTLNAGQTLNLR